MSAIHQLAAALKAPPAAGAFTPYSETWAGAQHAALPAGWTTITGTPSLSGLGQYDVTDSPGVATSAVRNLSGYNGTITFPIAAAAGVYNSSWTYIILRSNSAQTVYTYLLFRHDTFKLQYAEWNGSSDVNVVTGSTTLPDATWLGCRLTLNGAALTVELDTGSGYFTELTPTMAQNLTATYYGVGTSVASTGSLFGPVSFT